MAVYIQKFYVEKIYKNLIFIVINIMEVFFSKVLVYITDF